jgi:hypothetical protein
VGAGLVALSEPGAGICQETAGFGLPGRITEARGSHDCGALDSDLFKPVASPAKEIRHGPADLPGVDIEPGVGGKSADGKQYLALILSAGQQLLPQQVSCVDCHHPDRRSGQRAPVPGASPETVQTGESSADHLPEWSGTAAGSSSGPCGWPG